MSNVDQLAVCRCVSGLAFLAIAAMSCTSTHTPGSTETGNPPVIDIDEVALVVTADEVRIVGKPGAVMPGGAEIEVTAVGSDDGEQTKSNADGSFEITIDAGPDTVFEVRAKSGDAWSDPIYVSRGGALVGSADGGTLSCSQRSLFVFQAFGRVAGDNTCQTASDCVEADIATSCSATCGPMPVNKAAAARIAEAVTSVNTGVCRDFEADGCSVIIPPCSPPQDGARLVCINGTCNTATPDSVPECPPNARFEQYVCMECGPGGGCMTEATCAIVCSDSADCSDGLSCSPRGICEVVGCQ